MGVVNRFEVYLVALDPTVGIEIQKTRPSVVVSPNEMNHRLGTVICAPMTTRLRKYPTRVTCEFNGKVGQIALDQLRAVDKGRLVKHLGEISADAAQAVVEVLLEMFG